MDENRTKWKDEMDTMLAAIHRQTTHSLRVMKSIFKRCGRTLSPDFKQYFLQTISHSVKTSYEQFEIDSLFEDSTDANVGSVAVVGGALNNGQWGLKCRASIGQNASFSIDSSDDDDFVIETLGTEPIDDANEVGDGGPPNTNRNEIGNGTIFKETTSGDLNSKNEPMAIYELRETNNETESNTNEGQSIKQKVTNYQSFDVEMAESNDSIEMVENLSESINFGDSEFIPGNVFLHRLDETTSTGFIADKIKTTSANRKNQNSLTIKGKKSSTKQLAPKNQKRCAVCGYVGLHMGNFNRHMRTHTGEKPHRCNRCARSFTNAQSLKKHVAIHIAEFPFHCRACFHGFSLKSEMLDHEKHCRRRRYECHLCKKFVTYVKSKLIHHMRKHTGDKPFRCQMCVNRFTCNQSLTRHLNAFHPEFNERK